MLLYHTFVFYWQYTLQQDCENQFHFSLFFCIPESPLLYFRIYSTSLSFFELLLFYTLAQYELRFSRDNCWDSARDRISWELLLTCGSWEKSGKCCVQTRASGLLLPLLSSNAVQHGNPTVRRFIWGKGLRSQSSTGAVPECRELGVLKCKSEAEGYPSSWREGREMRGGREGKTHRWMV